MHSIMQDVRLAIRQFRNAPGFTFTAVAVLALGLGANIGVFTVLNRVLLKPFPFGHPDRVVKIELKGREPYYTFTYSNMLQLRDAVGPQLKIGGVFYQGAGSESIVGPEGRFQVGHPFVTAGLFDMLEVQPVLGRGFREGEDQPGSNQVLLIGYDVWEKVFRGDPGVIGQSVSIRRKPYTIVGVLPRSFGFHYYGSMTVWSPASLSFASRSAMQGSQIEFGNLYGRIPSGMSSAQLAAALSHAQAVIAKQVPDGRLAGEVRVQSYRDFLTGEQRRPLLLLYGVVIGIWALAILNVTSLMLARAVARTREEAVRAALGASRLRLLQQSILESIILTMMGSTCGALLSIAAIKLMWRQIRRQAGIADAQFDWRVALCLICFTLLSALITGILPALRATRRDVRTALTGVTTTASPAANRIREALVVAQLALTLVFLVGAGLFLRTIHAYRQVPLGFAEQNVLTGGVILNGNARESETPNFQQTNVVSSLYLPLLDRISAIPGVRVAALTSVLPMRPEMRVTISASIDHKEQAENENMADGRIVSSGLAEALGIPVIKGRFFTEEDTSSSPPVVVINQAYAKHFLPGQDPVGHVVSMAKKGRFAEMRIVGVVGDMKQLKLNADSRPEIYFPLAQVEPGTPLYGIATAFIQVAIRGSVPADTIRSQFEKALHDIAPDSTTTDVKTIHEAVEESFGSQTLIAHLLETFAALALMIACVGLYGLLAFVVAQRTREIGVRIALGAQQGNILSLVLRRAALLVLAGLAVGAALSWFGARFAQSYVFGVRAHDPLTFAAVATILGTMSLLAAWIPARRAATVDPILALRSE